MTEPEILESMLAPLRASFHAKRRERVGIVDKISRGLEAYVKAVDVAVTRDLCKAHGLAAPASGDNPNLLATELLHLVGLLPELAPGTKVTASMGVSGADSAIPSKPQPEPMERPKPRPTDAPQEHRWTTLLPTIAKAPLVIVGGTPRLERLSLLPVDYRKNVEWIDTTRQGTHAIGNLERRIRDHRIGALIILEGLVQHRHSDPLISAARSVALVHILGGKGGRAAMNQALSGIESRLSQQRDASPPKQ